MMADRNPAPGVSLQRLLQGLAAPLPAPDLQAGGLNLDSRAIVPGEVFLALKGYRGDGSRYILDAVHRGAMAVLLEEGLTAPDGIGVPVIPVADLRGKAGVIAARFYGRPSEKYPVIGITGTNGKTSVCHFIAQALSGRGEKVGCIGTLGYGLFPDLEPGPHTTPDAVTVQRLLAGFAAAAAGHAVMEVSSHALDQGRINGIDFDIAVFTNLSHEHLDFHGDMAGYAAAKRKLFQVPGLGAAVINANDEFGRELLAEHAEGVPAIGYATAAEDAVAPDAALLARLIPLGTDGQELDIHGPWGSGRLRTPLIGRFNADNLLAALAVLCLLEVPFEEAVQRLAVVRPVPGRMEVFGGAGAAVIVDYAHTPDALEQALATLKGLCRGRLVCIFGCGGDRDRDKRPLMGRVAERYADRVVITSDNPRGEDPRAIIEDITAGMTGTAEMVIDADRAGAITTAVRAARPEDVILIAGKGHETWQEIAGRRFPFSDRQLVRNLVGEGP